MLLYICAYACASRRYYLLQMILSKSSLSMYDTTFERVHIFNTISFILYIYIHIFAIFIFFKTYI